MVEQTQTDANPTLTAAKDQFVDSRRKGSAGRYATELDRVLSAWLVWCEDRGATGTSDISDRLLANYAQYLGRRVSARVSDPDDDDGISGRTAHQYWGYIRSFLSYCVEWGYIDQNPAKQGHVVDELPEESLGSNDDAEQTWSPDERRALLDYVDEQARDAIDADGLDATGPVRDRAIITLLAYTGARGAELFRDPDDDRREGLRWLDIDFESNRIMALGKSQDYEAVQFPEAAHSALRQHKRVQQPPDDDWPVFPTRHRPTLAQLEGDADGDRGDQPLADYLHEHGIEPPSITTTGVRSVLKRLCKDGEIPVEGDHEYLKPHGARRGIGKALYKNHSHEAAQKALRHQDPATTSEMYADIEAGEVAAIADDVLKNE
ncbi:tyrosine-type recombinase/integrase [Halomicrobium katesii]|uniref:tyrosine-type recombinase/integrase n=1 Tax=Halomicrobium katesii TaxID=437163 RepID=UPI000376D72D|nr:site-specific integrase [Halomicrobium katesii]